MNTEMLTKLLEALKRGTEQNRVHWEDLRDEEMFRAQVGPGLVRLGRSEGLDRQGYAMWLIAPGGAIAAEIERAPGEPQFDLLRDVYTAARLAARGGVGLINSMLTALPH